jgi:hypothetical protein
MLFHGCGVSQKSINILEEHTAVTFRDEEGSQPASLKMMMETVFLQNIGIFL